MAKNSKNDPARRDDVTADALRGKLSGGEPKKSGAPEFDINELLREYMADTKDGGETPSGAGVPGAADRAGVKADDDVKSVYDFDFPEGEGESDHGAENYIFSGGQEQEDPSDDEFSVEETVPGGYSGEEVYEEASENYGAADFIPDPAYFDEESAVEDAGEYVSEEPDDNSDDAVNYSGAAEDYPPEEVYSGETYENEADALIPDDAEPEDGGEDDDTISLPDDIDETDINLMVALGLEDELAKTVGVKTAEKLTEKIESEHMERVHSERSDPSKEFTSEEQIPEIVGKFRKMFTFSKIRLLLGALLLIAVAFYENLPMFDLQFSGALDPAVYPVVYVMVDLQLVLLGCGLSFDLIKKGFFNLFKGRISPESITFVTAAVSVLYSIWLAATATVPTEPVLFNLPVMLCLFMSMLYGHWRIKREIFSFNIVSSKGPKYIIRRLSAKDAASETEALGEGDLDDGDVLKIEKTDFVDGFFKRMDAKVYSNGAFITLALVLSVSLAAVAAVFTGVSSRSGSPVSDAVTVLYMGITAALPMSMLFTYGYPFYKANRDAYENDCTIVGENSLEEYTGASMITFDDKNVFPSYSVRVQNVRIYNNYRIDKVLYYATSVFAMTQGPLGDVFSVATAEMGHSEDVEIIDSGKGYIEAAVDGKSIIFGRARDLVDLGVSIPSSIIDEDDSLDEEISVMYMIYQQQLVAKMHVRYIIDPDFEYILRRLSGSGMCVCVRTFDPNIDEDMICRRIKKRQRPIRVLKYRSTSELGTENEHSEGGIVSRGNSKNLLQTVTSCDRVLNVKKTNAMLSIITSVMSIALLFIIVLSGRLSSITSVYLLANQIFWMLPMVISAKLIVG